MTLHQAAQKAVEAQIEDDGGPEAFARQAPFRALATQWLRDEFGSVEADNVGKEEFLRYVRLAERGALVGAALQQQPEPVAAGCPNYPGANVSTCIRDNLRPDCPLCGDVPPALQEVPREPVAEAARVLAEFAKTAPGRLPQRVQDAIALTASPSTTQQPSVDHALNTTPVVDHATQQQEAGSCDIVTLGGGIPGDPSGELTAICKGLVSAVAYGEHREVSALFDAPEQAHAFVRYLQRFVGNGVAASPSTTRQQETPSEQTVAAMKAILFSGRVVDTFMIHDLYRAALAAAPSTPENAGGVPVIDEVQEAAYQRGKRAGYSEGFRAGRNGVPAVAPTEPKPALIEINYELGGRWWHMNCHDKDGKYMPSGIMREVERDKEAKRSLIRCMRCGEQGYYQFGWVGLARVPMEPSTAGVPACAWPHCECPGLLDKPKPDECQHKVGAFGVKEAPHG